MSAFQTELDVVSRLVRTAGDAVMAVYAQDFAVFDKADGSPITAADRAANDILVAGLRKAFPQDAILSEEAPFQAGPSGRVWMVDPLDGTSDFAGRTGDFSIMVGLCVDRTPVFGVVHAPALERTWSGAPGHGAVEWSGGAPGHGAVEWSGGAPRPLKVVPPGADDPVRVLVSRKHRPPQIEAILELIPRAEPLSRGSVGIKCGLVASGDADLYLHPTRGTSLWDCCAPQAILEAAGGRFTNAHGQAVPYDPQHPPNPHGILATHPALHGSVLQILANRGTTESPSGH